MRMTRVKLAAATGGLALLLAGCGDAGGDTASESVDVEVDDQASEGKFDDGTRMAELAESGEITIGVKYDQPGLGFSEAGSDQPTGFDVEIAKLLAADLGIDAENVQWEETISDNREPFLESGRVDLVLATYSITDERKEIVGQTGPYFVTGQQVLVPSDSDVESIDDLADTEVCAASGSTSFDNINLEGARAVGADNYSDCADDVLTGSVPAMSTDGAILLGYAAQNPDELKVVGPEFSEERIGVGYSPEAPEMCEWINGVLEESFENGDWEAAFDATLGQSGEDAPEPPELDACEA